MLQVLSEVSHAAGAPLDVAAVVPGLALATAIGLLIGAERGWRMREEEPGTRVAGVRTFAILGLLGGLAALAGANGLGPIGLVAVLAAVAMLLIGYHSEMRSEAHLSATSAIAAVTTLLLGALAASGDMALASIGAGAMVALLACREALHGALGRTSQAEMTALIRLALVIFLILPILPDTEIGPWGGINPRRIWFVVVVVGAMSLAGYALARWRAGRGGTLLVALVGALVSSTAVTIDAARRIRERGANAADDGAISLASVVMLSRVFVLTAAIAPSVLRGVLVLLAPGFVMALAISMVQLRLALRETAEERSPARPPSLSLALLFAALVAVLSLGARWAEQYLGSGSGVLVIALGGMIDVDSSIAAVGALPSGELSPSLAALAIAGPVIFNTLLKLGLVLGIGGLRRTRNAAGGLAATAAMIATTVAVRWL